MKIVLYGAGKRCEKFLIQHNESLHVDRIFDNKRRRMFHHLCVSYPKYNKEYFIIVTVDSYESYHEIKRTLRGLGYREFLDFVPWQIYGKKMAVGDGNCHMMAVVRFLEKSSFIKETYGFYPFPGIQFMTTGYYFGKDELECVLTRCDLFLHQSIQNKNTYGEEFASSRMLEMVDDRCKILALPNLYGLPKCFFPQWERLSGGCTTKYGTNGVDMNIREWTNEGIDTILMEKYISDGGYMRTIIFWNYGTYFKIS